MEIVIDEKYLPFTVNDLKQHFIADADRQIDYLISSARRYHEFLNNHPQLGGIPITKARTPRQIEKDERFWTISATKLVYDDPLRESILCKLLSKAYGDMSTIHGFSSWKECIQGDLKLYFEVCIPSSPEYLEWLRNNLETQQMIPYVLDAASRQNSRPLEGATHVDAMFLNRTNNFSIFIEAKVLSDISYSISFDNFRNQIARNIDVMLTNTSQDIAGLEKRNPDRSIFCLLTPAQFKQMPHSRLYGWMMHDYQDNPEALARDLGHRKNIDWNQVTRRIGWLTFEDFEETRPGTCSWLQR
jgi:hypothetical protein